MNESAFVLAMLMAVCASVLIWLGVKVSRIEANAYDTAAEERLRKDTEQSRLFPTYGEDDQ